MPISPTANWQHCRHAIALQYHRSGWSHLAAPSIPNPFTWLNPVSLEKSRPAFSPTAPAKAMTNLYRNPTEFKEINWKSGASACLAAPGLP